METTSTSKPSQASVSAETSRRPSGVSTQATSRNRRSSRCLHEIQVQPRPTERSLSQHQLLLLTPFGAPLPMGSLSAAESAPKVPSSLSHGLSANPESVSFVPLTRSEPTTQRGSLSAPKLGAIRQPKVVGSLLSVEMTRSTSMPAFTRREVEANVAKDADLGLSRGDPFVWMDDHSR